MTIEATDDPRLAGHPGLAAYPATQQPKKQVPARISVPEPARLSPHGLKATLGGGAAGVVTLWGAQVRPSARLDALFATAAHLTGLLAGYGVLVMLLLMARVPAIEHGIGADRLARWHGRGGRHVLTLCLAHMVLALCGYAAHTGTDLLSAARDLLGYGAIAAAALGTALLVAVGVTSVRAVRGRVRHETWRAVHLLAYSAAALAFAHQLVGPDIAGSVLAAWVWAMLHATVAVLLLWYRGVVPLRQALRHSLRVLDVRREGPDVVSVVVQGIGLAELRAEPGQFFRWRFLQGRLWRTALPFSLSAPVRDDTLRITVKAIGDHTRRIRRLKPGTRVLATGPFGAMTAHRRTRRKVLLIAGGVGITPMRALFETLPRPPATSHSSTVRTTRPNWCCARSWRPSLAPGRPGCTISSGPPTPPSTRWRRRRCAICSPTSPSTTCISAGRRAWRTPRPPRSPGRVSPPSTSTPKTSPTRAGILMARHRRPRRTGPGATHRSHAAARRRAGRSERARRDPADPDCRPGRPARRGPLARRRNLGRRSTITALMGATSSRGDS